MKPWDVSKIETNQLSSKGGIFIGTISKDAGDDNASHRLHALLARLTTTPYLNIHTETRVGAAHVASAPARTGDTFSLLRRVVPGEIINNNRRIIGDARVRKAYIRVYTSRHDVVGELILAHGPTRLGSARPGAARRSAVYAS